MHCGTVAVYIARHLPEVALPKHFRNFHVLTTCIQTAPIVGTTEFCEGGSFAHFSTVFLSVWNCWYGNQEWQSAVLVMQWWIAHHNYNLIVMHHSFVVTAPMGPGNSGSFNFSVFKALLNALHCGDTFMVKSLLKAPAPQRLTIMKNNKWSGPFE